MFQPQPKVPVNLKQNLKSFVQPILDYAFNVLTCFFQFFSMTQVFFITYRAPTEITYSVAIYNPCSIRILTKE